MPDEMMDDELDRPMRDALSSLRPARGGVAAEEVMAAFWSETQRRQQSARWQLWAWRGASGVLAASLAIAILPGRPAPRALNAPVESASRPQITAIPSVNTDDASLSTPVPTYLLLRQRVLEQGLSALPKSSDESGGIVPLPSESDGV